ncbi:MAG: nitroreductase family protein [Parasporobacterium sp.]|nr:nitroreductase family protein [Parasporobacterium sp.]
MKKHTWKIGIGIVLTSVLMASPALGQEEAIQLVEDVSTIQSFAQTPVAQEDIEKIVAAGINSPSAVNQQPWHFSVVTDSAILEEIAGGGASSGDASDGGESAEGESPDMEGSSEGTTAIEKTDVADIPLAIVISCKTGSEFDAGLACQTMSIEAQLLGYGTKIVSSPTMVLNGKRQEEFRELLNIPQDQSVAAVLMIGMPAEGYDAVSSASTRKPEQEIVSYH